MRVLPMLLILACGDTPPTLILPAPELSTDSSTFPEPEVPLPESVEVTVTLDGAPAEGVTVQQGGAYAPYETDAQGRVTLPVDPTVVGNATIVASHPEARTKGSPVEGPTMTLVLERFSTVDNEAYVFGHPGPPEDRGDTSKCGHCHISLSSEWSASMHRTSASNPRVQDVYAGVSADLTDAASCAAAGGQWWQGIEPGTLATTMRCYIGEGALPDLNSTCGDTEPCDGVAQETGACADCHAPGIDGALGGRDLLEATGHAYDYGIHCDVCHKVESVDIDAEAGVAGRLRVLRPSDSTGDPMFQWTPLSFGPFDDVANPVMGAVKRDHFRDTTLCAGCHQLDQPVLVPGAAADLSRWPDGRIPVHSTWQEWRDGPMNPGAPCQACHMPPNPEAGNGADLYNETSAPLGESIVTGWPRPPGSVRSHVWVGPRSPEIRDMLGLAATVTLDPRWEGTEWVVDATVKNVGPGHAIPTGEPARQLLLVVEAECAGQSLDASGGDVLPDYAGSLDVQPSTADWTRWPGAQVGDRIRVVQRTGAWHDYDGFGAFASGGWPADQKGLPVEHFAGEVRVASVAGDIVTLDGPLPSGDVAYRVPAASLPQDGEPVAPLAGAPGFGFARVMVGAAGQRMVAHHAAVDIASDNRLLPQQSWTSSHRFDGTGCANPTTRAVLVHRAFPHAQAVEKAWTVTESVMVEVSL